MARKPVSLPIGLSEEDVLYYLCEAIEGKPEWARTDKTMTKLVQDLMITGDVYETLHKAIPDAEWKEAYELLVKNPGHHPSYTPPGGRARSGSPVVTQEPATPAPTPVPEPSVGPNNQVTDFPEEPEDDEPGELVADCYVVICHDEEFDKVEIIPVLAAAARFARRAARKEWVKMHKTADGIEFNARAAGPEFSN